MTQIRPDIRREKLSQFRGRWFAEGSRPTATTLKRAIDDKLLSGEVVFGRYYVLVTGWGEPLWYKSRRESRRQPAIATPETGNQIADRILREVSKACRVSASRCAVLRNSQLRANCWIKRCVCISKVTQTSPRFT